MIIRHYITILIKQLRYFVFDQRNTYKIISLFSNPDTLYVIVLEMLFNNEINNLEKMNPLEIERTYNIGKSRLGFIESVHTN